MPDKRRGLLVPAIATLAMLVVFIGLGIWQIERKAWKEDLIDTLTRGSNSSQASCRALPTGRGSIPAATNSAACG